MAFSDKIRLTEAAKIVGVSVGALRAERDRGRLVIWRVANKDWTSLAEIERMFELCQEKPKARDCGSDRPEPRTASSIQPSGSSSMEAANAALAAALNSKLKPSKSSRPTSRKNTSQTGAEIVRPAQFQSLTS